MDRIATPRPPSTLQVGRLGVHAQARLGHALDAGERTLAVRAVLELDDEVLADDGVLHLPARDVALRLEDLRDVRLQLRERDQHGVVVSRVRVTQPREQVCDGVGHGHGACALPRRGIPPPRGQDLPTFVLLGLLPAALGDAGKLAAVGHLAHADPAQAELAVHRVGPAATLAARVATHRELRLGSSLVLEAVFAMVRSP